LIAGGFKYRLLITLLYSKKAYPLKGGIIVAPSKSLPLTQWPKSTVVVVIVVDDGGQGSSWDGAEVWYTAQPTLGS
jgi:hypothetical protein